MYLLRVICCFPVDMIIVILFVLWFSTGPYGVEQLSAVSDNETVHLSWQRPDQPNGDILKYQINWHSKNSIKCTGYLETVSSTTEPVSIE